MWYNGSTTASEDFAMNNRRVLTIQDISCVGQCSMTIALPVLSAWGLETCVLPTAVLSTHTGGFGKPVVVHLDDTLEKIWRHWQENQITFDAILTGYLGTTAAAQAAADILERFLAPGGISIVDPAMADNGRMYAGLDETYARAVGALCRRADVILPNWTEASILSGVPYRETAEEESIRQTLEQLGHPCVILTGLPAGEHELMISVRERGTYSSFRHRRVEGHFSGTGDLFAACFTGALMRGMDKGEAAQLAGELTSSCVQYTAADPAHWYGLRFESILPRICQLAQK